jgi:5-methylcytosine-specific restriction protein A
MRARTLPLMARPWEAKRGRVLKVYPLCAICGVAPSTEVDHITPRAYGGGHEFANLRGVCRPCHLALSRAMRDKRGPRPKIVRPW